MKRILLKISLTSVRIAITLISSIVVYFLFAVLFSCIPCNKFCVEGDIEIYIRSNGVHTDLVLPIRNEYKDWTEDIDVNNTLLGDTDINYMAFGWGDKGFYLETPTWADLKLSTAFKAMFALSSSAIHVTNYKILHENNTCKKIKITEENYEKLVEYIESYIRKDGTGKAICIKNHYYGNNDSFYEAKGSYSLFQTCNTWANGALKYAGLRACLWTPFDKGIFYQYKKM